MKLSQLIESFVISNDAFEDYLNRATEQLISELSSGKNPRDAVHDLALTFADQHNKSYDAYTRMAESLSARMHTLELDGSTSTDIAPMGMDMNLPSDDEMPGDSDMEDYSAVMNNKPEIENIEEGRMSDKLIGDSETMTKTEFTKKYGKDLADEMYESINEDDDAKRVIRALAKADEPERGEERKKVSLKKAPWEESVNEGGDQIKVKVIFRKFPEGDVIALFPEEDQGRGLIGSYMTVGQHSDASKSLITELEPASKEEAAKLADELKRIGYDVVMAEPLKEEEEECKYCGGDCPNDEEHACDGYLGDIDGLYEAKASVIDQLQSIVDDRQAKSIKFDDGSSKVDMFTASAITQVYANVNDANKAKIEKMLNSRAGLIKVAKFAMGALKEGKLNEVPLVAPLLGLVGRAVAGAAGRAATGGVAKGVAKGVGKAAKAANVARKIGPAISTAKAFVKGAQDAYTKDPYTKATGRHLESTEKKADDIMKSAINKVNKK